MNTVAQVGGGAGILCGAESRCIAVGEERVFGVESSRAFALVLVLPFVFAFPLLSLIFTGMKVCSGRDEKLSLIQVIVLETVRLKLQEFLG